MSSSSGADSGGGGGDGAARVTIICSVCTDPLMGDGAVQVATPCGHVYHKHCLINWYTSSKQYCCPICDARTESDSECKFRLFLNTEEDSDYRAVLQTVTQLRREKEEVNKALVLLSEERMEVVDRLRQEHSEKVERLRQEHDKQMKRLQRDQVKILRQEKAKTKTLERTIQDIRQEKVQTLEWLRQEQDEQIKRLQRDQVDILRQENAKNKTLEQTIRRLSEENAQNLERLRKEQKETLDRVRLENSEKAERLWQFMKFQKKQIQLLKDEIQCQKDEIQRQKDEIQRQKDEIQRQKDEIQCQKDEIRNLNIPMDLPQKRVKTLECDKLLDEATRGNSGSGECDGAEAPGFEGGGVAAALSQGHLLPSAKKYQEAEPISGQIRVPPFKAAFEPIGSRGAGVGQTPIRLRMTARKSTAQWVPAFKGAPAGGSVVQGTSSCITSSVGTKVNPLSKWPDLEIISEKQKPIIVPATSTTPPQPGSSNEKRGVSAAEGSGVASKKQKINDTKNLFIN